MNMLKERLPKFILWLARFADECRQHSTYRGAETTEIRKRLEGEYGPIDDEELLDFKRLIIEKLSLDFIIPPRGDAVGKEFIPFIDEYEGIRTEANKNTIIYGAAEYRRHLRLQRDAKYGKPLVGPYIGVVAPQMDGGGEEEY